MHTLCAAGCNVLCDFALVVRKHQVHSSTVDIELLAKVFLPHHRTLEVPAGKAFAPWGRPVHNMLRLSLFPEGKVKRSALVALSVKAAGAFQGIIEIASGKDPVVMVLVVFRDIEVDAAVADVGVASIQYLLDSLYLLDNVSGGTGLDGRRSDVQLTHSLVIAQGICLHDLHRLELLEAGLLCYLVLSLVGIMLQMPHVGDVAHVTHLVSEMAQELEKDVVGHSRTGVPEMGVTIDGWAADIHPHMPGIHGLEDFFVAGEGIGEEKSAHVSLVLELVGNGGHYAEFLDLGIVLILAGYAELPLVRGKDLAEPAAGVLSELFCSSLCIGNSLFHHPGLHLLERYV